MVTPNLQIILLHKIIAILYRMMRRLKEKILIGQNNRNINDFKLILSEFCFQNIYYKTLTNQG